MALRKPEIHYYGMLREDQDDVKTQLGTQLYNYWDQSSEAPPKVRPREAIEAPVLQALAWNNGEVHFPDQFAQQIPRQVSGASRHAASQTGAGNLLSFKHAHSEEGGG